MCQNQDFFLESQCWRISDYKNIMFAKVVHRHLHNCLKMIDNYLKMLFIFIFISPFTVAFSLKKEQPYAADEIILHEILHPSNL